MDFDSAKTKKCVDKLDTEKYFFLFFGPHFFANPLCRATLSLRPALRRSGFATLPIGGRLFLLSIKYKMQT